MSHAAVDFSPENYHAVNQLRREFFSPGAPRDISLTELKLWHADAVDHNWRSQYLKDMPDFLAGYFGHRYEKLLASGKSGRRRANTFLRNTIGKNVLPRLKKVTGQWQKDYSHGMPSPFKDNLDNLPTYGRDQIRDLSYNVANYLAETFNAWTEDSAPEQTPDKNESRQRTAEAYVYLAREALKCGTTPPFWNSVQKTGRIKLRNAESALLRMMSPEWWRVRLKRRRDLQREHMAIAVGQVQRTATAYVSRSTLGEWVEQKKRNREFFKRFDLINEDGDRIAMAAQVDRSNANPAIRRCELMARMRGFEDIANDMGCAGVFYTITAPSRYHSVHNKGGFVSQWNGSSPRETQKYLCKVWSKIRAALSREEIHLFGFRVVEPHHDGTPHWHMLFFMLPEHKARATEIMAKYAREEDADELNTPQALKARFHAEDIDPAKGSATGYIAKYISKNIDGYALGDEADGETGGKAKEMAKAVSAWASRWRIRQFQQIGGAPVTVWRELRRMRGQTLDDPKMDAVLAAADVAVDWAAYTQAQGGPLVARDALVIRLAYEITECGNEYGEDVQRVQGIYSPHVSGSEVPTRLVKWEKVAKLSEAVAKDAVSGRNAAPWSSVNNCTGAERRRLELELRSRGFEGNEAEISILLRGSVLDFAGAGKVKFRNGRVIDSNDDLSNEMWPGWS
ncbi:replication endonuclease [Erwinia sp. AnSW2-5]|uniref:replication endonuclease n=1 Tax=Erwinia sp. AnSW2-5 TaxID=3367692 RepID=UPI00385B9FB4